MSPFDLPSYDACEPRHDLKSYDIWVTKSEDRETALYHSRLQHLLQRQSEAHRQAAQLIDESHSAWFGVVDCLQSATDTMARISSISARIQRIHQCQSNDICVLVLVNWSAPCLISAPQQACQASVLGGIVNGSSPNCIGLVISPSHTYGKGKLWKQQEMSHKHLVNANLNIDMSFVLPYKQRSDERDQRQGVLGANNIVQKKI